MSLAATREELVSAIQESLSVLLEPVLIQDVGSDLEEVAAWFQSLAICNLLLYADTDRFYENLVRSGHTRRYFLRKSAEEDNRTDYQLAISRWDSFLDVVAAGHFALAREIVTLSRDAWVSTGEYEDDFLYRWFLHQFIAPPVADREARLQETLARWHAWCEGERSVRLECCVALLARNAAGFAQAFEDLIAARQAEIAAQRSMALAADITFEPRTHVFIEGLALLRIAEALDFSLPADYPLCPGLARAPATSPFPDDIFPEIERERARGPH
jgi:hypothetical protein